MTDTAKRSEATLKPCPFCGGEAEAVHEINGFWTVECIKCGALVDGIEAWNTRVDDYNLAAKYWQRMYEDAMREHLCLGD